MYILAEQLHDDDERDPLAPWRRYKQYLQANKDRFPKSAFKLACGALLDRAHPNNPHDAWLEWAHFEEPSKGARNEVRHVSLRVRLLGAWHDRYIELYYPRVYAYSLNCPAIGAGHWDWRYNEVRLGENGKSIVHEIEWAGPPDTDSRWLIEASNILMRAFPIEGRSRSRTVLGSIHG